MKNFADMTIRQLGECLAKIKNEIESRDTTWSRTILYMNEKTGEIDAYDGWYYTDDDGKSVNAVDLGQVVVVEWNHENCEWEAVWIWNQVRWEKKKPNNKSGKVMETGNFEDLPEKEQLGIALEVANEGSMWIGRWETGDDDENGAGGGL